MYNKNIFLWLCAIVAAPQLFATQPNPQALGEQNQSAQTKFWENKGQIKDHDQQTAHFVKFGYQSGNTQVFLLETGLAYQFSKLHYPEGYQHDSKNLSSEARKTNDALREKIRLETFRMDMQLVGANPNPRISREGKSTDYINYYNHNVLGLYGYEKITYHEIYQGVDWVVYTNKEGLKYDFVVRPNADIRNIKMRFEHQEDLRLNADGSFTLSNAMGTITEKAPVSFQNGKEIATRFVLNGNELSFAIANYDPSQPLTIDPSVLWATYYGGGWIDEGSSCAIDVNGDVYLAGGSLSSNSIASGGHQNTFGGNYDAFLVKFNSNGVRQWATYYGGTATDFGYTCATDAAGNVYLAGETRSMLNIAAGGHQNTFAGTSLSDGFLVKFNPSGTRLWATYYGGTANDIVYSCVVDANSNVYLAGKTNSSSNIASGGYQNSISFGGYDAFLVKFNSAGVRLWATYYGGSGDENSNGCAVDTAGNIYLSGSTYAFNLASGGHQNTFGGTTGSDAFLVKFNSTGARLWATYYGGTGDDMGFTCATDRNGNIYLAGQTTSSTNINSNGHQNTHNGGTGTNVDGFLVKFNPAGTRLWATYYGGTGDDAIADCVIDNLNNVCVIGHTNSNTNIASGGHQNTFGGSSDAFLVKLDSNGVRQWGTYYGGTNDDIGLAGAADAAGNLYVVGWTRSLSAIALGGHQNTFGGDAKDGFLAKFDNSCNTTGSFSQTICAGQSFLFNGVNLSTSGAYLDTLVATNGCDSFLTLNLNVLPVQTGSFSQTICAGQSFFFNGLNRNTSGTYLDTLVASNGCDSFLTLNLNVLPVQTGSFSQTICAGQSFFFNGLNRNTSGAYLDTLVASNGCDSFLTLNLVVQNVDISVTNNGNSLTANNSNASYQWINCNDNSLIINEDNQTFTPNGNGVYAVVVIENGCVDTSACITITNLENYSKNSFSVFPNPSADAVNITFSQIANQPQINLYNSIGQLVYTQQFTNNVQQFSFSLSPLPVGVYWLSIQEQNGQIYTQKIVKE